MQCNNLKSGTWLFSFIFKLSSVIAGCNFNELYKDMYEILKWFKTYNGILRFTAPGPDPIFLVSCKGWKKVTMRSNRQCITRGKCKTRAIQVDLGLFTHMQAYVGIFSYSQAYSGIIKAYSEPCVTLWYSEPWYIQNQRHIQNLVKYLRWS